MSSTAQKQDLTDPDVIAAFARQDGHRAPARPRSTCSRSPTFAARVRKVWNNWKGKLLEDLYHARARCSPAPSPTRTIMDSIEARRSEAQRLLRLYAVPDGAEANLWKHLDTPYFQRHSADEIAWHARHLYWRVEQTRTGGQGAARRATAPGLQVLVYLPDQKELFARLCGFFGRAGLSILEAKIHTTRAGYALDTFALHDPSQPTAVVSRDDCSSSSSS